MNKFFAAAAFTLVAATATVQTAAAFPIIIIPLFPKAVPQATEVGNAFQPFQHVATEAELRALCHEKGGELKKRFNGNDYEWVCVG